MRLYFYKIFTASILMSLNCYAQNEFISERTFEPEALKAPGVERVGAVPLPRQDFGNISVSQRGQYSVPSPSKLVSKSSFESTYVPGRTIYLNGENVSSIRDQDLEGVDVHIDKNGNLHISAPQYEVLSEQSYHPLLPKELPKFKKDNVYEQMPLPQGVFSKQSGKPTQSVDGEHSAETPAPMAKEIIPEANEKPTIPAVEVKKP
ncbi:MAG: hypothetical protein V4591_02580 [Bdellovibrionota bacterium]